MKQKKLIIFGVGELAELAAFYFENDSNYHVVAFCADPDYITADEYCGKPLISFDFIEDKYPPAEYDMFIAIGYSDKNENRKRKYYEAKNKKYILANYISSKNSFWPQLEVGENTFIMENNTIMPFCKIGNNVLIWVGNIIAHHMVIEDHVTITSHCAIGGNAVIEEGCFLGLNCTIRNNITIKKGCVIATSANVIKTTEENSTYMGNPAKKVAEATKTKI